QPPDNHLLLSRTTQQRLMESARRPHCTLFRGRGSDCSLVHLQWRLPSSRLSLLRQLFACLEAPPLEQYCELILLRGAVLPEPRSLLVAQLVAPHRADPALYSLCTAHWHDSHTL